MAAQESAASESESKGIGLWVAQLFDPEASDYRGALVVLEVLPRSPASVSGLLAGDRITRICGRPTSEMTLEEAVTKYLRAATGARVQLDLERTGGAARVELQIE